jgi:2-keto-myo-inositol isomerase
MDFALNQKTAPKLGFAVFLDLAAELGCVGVEPRNDLGRPLFDGIAARERGLRFIGLSEVYPFNDWNEDRHAAVARLIETAQAAGAETISLIPRVDRREGDDVERATTLRAVLVEILPMLHGTGVVGLVEPIGFQTSSIKFHARRRRRSKVLTLTIALELFTTHSSMRWRGIPT